MKYDMSAGEAMTVAINQENNSLLIVTMPDGSIIKATIAAGGKFEISIGRTPGNLEISIHDAGTTLN